MVDFWTNHFNIFAGKGVDRWLLPAYDRDTIRPNAMSKFSTLLQATAQSPAMLFYLDNFQSVAPNAQRGGPNRPAARRNSIAGLGVGDEGRRAANAEMRQQNAANTQQRANLPPNPQQQRRGINENYARELM